MSNKEIIDKNLKSIEKNITWIWFEMGICAGLLIALLTIIILKVVIK